MLDVSKLKHIVFDWDNTLVESRSSLVAAVDKVLAYYNLPSWDNVRHLRDCNLSFKDNFPRIFGDKADEAYNHLFTYGYASFANDSTISSQATYSPKENFTLYTFHFDENGV